MVRERKRQKERENEQKTKYAVNVWISIGEFHVRY